MKKNKIPELEKTQIQTKMKPNIFDGSEKDSSTLFKI